MPESVTGKGLAVPFPYVGRETFKRAFSVGEINAAIDSAPKEVVALGDLHAIQHSVREERLRAYIEHRYQELIPEGQRHYGHGGVVDTPIVVKRGGRLTIWDGHHRLTAEWLLGEAEAEVRLADLDGLARV